MNRTRFTTYLILAAFIGIAVFGFAAMGGHDTDSHSDCIATIGQASLCPYQNILSMTALHAQLFQKITSTASLIILLSIVSWVVLERLNRKRIGAVFHVYLTVLSRRLLKITYTLQRHSLLSWLAVRKRGDASFSFAMNA